MDFTCISLGIIFCAFGLIFVTGNGHKRLTAWQSRSDEEKAAIKIEPLCRNVGLVIASSGVIFLCRGLWPAAIKGIFIYAMILWLILAGFDVWYIGRSKRYRNQ